MGQGEPEAPMRLYEEESAPEAISAKYGVPLDDIVDFSVNVNPFGPPPAAFSNASQAIESAGLYPDLHLKDLRRVLAERHGLSGDCFMFGAGLDDVLKLISQAWLGPSKTVLIHVPTFPRYELEARIVGARMAFVDSEEPWRIDVSRLDQTLREQPIDVAYLCSPNNPTGARITVEAIEHLAAAYRSTIFVVDEALVDPAQSGAMPLVKDHANIAVLRTFSKYFGLAGLRVGYAVGQPDIIASLTAVRPPFNVSGFSSRIAMSALQNDAFLEASRRAFAEERAFVSNALEAFPALCVRGACSNMMLISLSNMRAGEFVGALAQRGVIVVDATSFRGLEKFPSIRVSLRTRPENTRLIATIADVLPQG